MKILFVLTYYYPHWTGLTQYAVRLAEGLARKKYSVRVVTTRHDSNLPLYERVHGVDVIRNPVLFRISRTLVSLSLLVSLLKEISNTDRIVIYLPFAEVLWATVIGKVFKKKIYLVHNGDLLLPEGCINRFFEGLYFLTTRIAIRLSTSVIVQTSDYAKQSRVLSDFAGKIKIILPLYPKKRQIKRTNKPVFDMSLPVRVGFAGRFVREKGFDLLFQAIPLVMKRIPAARFFYAGDTDIPYEHFFTEVKPLLGPIRKYINFMGKLDEAGMTSFYKYIDVLVVPSRSDCFPSVLVEALLSGVPVVVSDIPGARIPVQKTGMGCIVDAENPAKLSDAIIDTIRKKDTYQKNSNKVKQIFDYEKTLGAYQSLLEV